MITEGQVTIAIADVPNILYSEAKVMHGEDWVRVCIADAHTNVVLIEENGKVTFKADVQGSTGNDIAAYSMKGVRARDVFEFALNAPLEMIDFIGAAGSMNNFLAKKA